MQISHASSFGWVSEQLMQNIMSGVRPRL